MGTLRTTIELNDKFSKQLEKINKSIHATTRAMSSLQKAQLSSTQLLRYEELKVAQAKQKTVQAATRVLAAEQRTEQATKRQNARLREQEGIYNRIQRIATRIRNVMTLWYTAQMGVGMLNATVGLSDKMTMADARLNLMADKDNPLSDLKAKSFGAAQRSTTDYLEFTKAVSKMGILAGDKFANQDSVIRFTELMNKQFQVGGAELSERQAAMLQLTQAIASNRLGGDELRTIRETAPLLVKYIQKSLNVGEAEFKKLAKEGEITADVIIKAMAESSVELEKMYEQLPLTWERVWTRMKNVGVMAFTPIQEQFKRLFNNQKFLQMMNGITDAMIVVGNLGGWAFEKLFDALGSLYNGLNALGEIIQKVSPMIISLIISTGLVASAYALWWLRINGVALATRVLTGLLKVQVVWQTIVNAVTTNWGAIIVGVVIVALALLIYWIYKMSDSWADAFGKIVGSVYVVGEVIRSVFVGICQGIVVLINNLIVSLRQAFWSFLSWVVDAWAGVLSKLNVGGVFDDAIAKAKTVAQKNDAKAFNAKFDYKTLDTSELFNFDKAYNTGYTKGSGFVGKIEGAFKNMSDLTKLDLDMKKTELDALNGIAGNTAKTAEEAEKTAKNTGYQEDYSYLRDWSYQKGLGTSIGYNVKIEQNNRNSIGSELDLERVATVLGNKILDGLYSGSERAEGVY